MMNRRGFLASMLAAAAAPAIVRAASLMPVTAPKIIHLEQGIFTGEVGSYDGLRIYESHLIDAVAWGIGVARMYQPEQREANRLTRESLDAAFVRIGRYDPRDIFPPSLIVHPEWAHDLRKAGIPVLNKL